jgi:hypothetical protein
MFSGACSIMGRDGRAALALAALLSGPAEARAEEAIPFEIHRLRDEGGPVAVDYQLILPPPNSRRPAYAPIRARLLREFFPEEAHVTADPPAHLLARTQATLLREFDESYGGQPEPTAQRWRDERVQRVVEERHGLLVIEHLTYSETGGAHGNGRRVFLIFNERTGEEMMLSDLFRPGAEEELTRRIKEQLRARGGGRDLAEQGYWEPEIRAQNLYITREGLGFHYNPYEIAAYVKGPTDVRFTFGELRQLVRPDGPLAPLLPPP